MTDSTTYQVPDATLGLQTYNLNREPWTEREDLTKNDRIKLFDINILAEILRHFKLEGPYKRKSPKAVSTSCPMFGFGLWEAKKSTGESHIDIFHQTARKLATLLRWQRKIFNTAECEDTCPLVWFFSSAGSSWEISGCYEIKNPHEEGYSYVSFVCFYTCMANRTKARGWTLVWKFGKTAGGLATVTCC